MYTPVERDQIAGTLVHLRNLFRQIKPSNDAEYRTREKREIVAKNLLSNLSRIKEHPTLSAVLEIADAFLLTLDGAHRLFGYDLDGIRDCDLDLNRSRTHVIESYPFRRDISIELPSILARKESFRWDTTLANLVLRWQTEIPIRVLEEEGWHQEGTFYVHVGTEDSLGSNLPPGSIALVEPIEESERRFPDPRTIYLLQFGNGYRCNRCVRAGNRLILLVPPGHYACPQEFAYPSSVRIAGRIRAFALGLPLIEPTSMHSLPMSLHPAPLIMPWAHPTIGSLFAAKHLRFQRSKDDDSQVRGVLEDALHSRLSGRTERRYRHHTTSQPHVDVLIQLAVMNIARYSDALRAHGSLRSDLGRYSLDTLLRTKSVIDLPQQQQRSHFPTPSRTWEDRRREFGEWPSLLSARFPKMIPWKHSVIRLSQGSTVSGLNPPLSEGTLLMLEPAQKITDPSHDRRKTGWARSLYTMQRGADFLLGHLDREGDRYVLDTDHAGKRTTIALAQEEFDKLNRVCGIAVPV